MGREGRGRRGEVAREREWGKDRGIREGEGRWGEGGKR